MKAPKKLLPAKNVKKLQMGVKSLSFDKNPPNLVRLHFSLSWKNDKAFAMIPLIFEI